MNNIERYIKFMGRWYKAEEKEDRDIGLYYLVEGHIIPAGELEEIGKYITLLNNPNKNGKH